MAQPYSTILVSPGFRLPFFGCQFPDKNIALIAARQSCRARSALDHTQRAAPATPGQWRLCSVLCPSQHTSDARVVLYLLNIRLSSAGLVAEVTDDSEIRLFLLFLFYFIRRRSHQLRLRPRNGQSRRRVGRAHRVRNLNGLGPRPGRGLPPTPSMPVEFGRACYRLTYLSVGLPQPVKLKLNSPSDLILVTCPTLIIESLDSGTVTYESRRTLSRRRTLAVKTENSQPGFTGSLRPGP